MFLLDRIGQYQSPSWERHIHAPGNDNRTDESLGPVRLRNRGCSNEYVSGQERAHGTKHDPARAPSADHSASCDGGCHAGDGERTDVSNGEEGALAA